jgi:hypothetical protein
MNTTALYPRVSEFETQEQADSYDHWFHVKVQEAVGSDKPRIPHDEIVRRMHERLARLRQQAA